MANSFTFPPPPPPPPAASSYGSPGAGHPSHRPQQSYRGRGGYNSGFQRGGGGGSERAGYGAPKNDGYGPRSGYSYQQRNGFRQPTNQSNSWGSTQSKPYTPYTPSPASSQAYTNGHNHAGYRDYQHRPAEQYGMKRSHDQAFQNKSTTTKLQTAPAVPSFGFELPLPTAPKKPILPKAAPAVPQKPKLLGLIPIEEESNASDEDEEAKLAAACTTAGAALSFSYKGKSSTLRTADDIAAWIAERRRNFPTAAKREIIAKRKAEESAKNAEKKEAIRKKILETTKKRHPELNQQSTHAAAKRETKDSRRPAAKGMTTPPTPITGASLSKEQLKMERLRRTIAKNAKLLAKLEAANKSKSTVPVSAVAKKSDTDLLDDSATSDSDISSDDEASSSDLTASEDSDTSSDSDIDESDADESDQVIDMASDDEMTEGSLSDSDTPQELSSIPAVPAVRGKREDKRALCRIVKKGGRCRRTGCKFRHKVRDGEIDTKTQHLAPKPAPRMSLYQRLLKQQIEEEEQQAQQQTKVDGGIAIAV